MGDQSKDSKRTTREKAQAAREAAEAEQRRRDRRIRLIGGAVILVAVALIVGLGYWGAHNNPGPPNSSGGIVADAARPAGALDPSNANAFGVPYKTSAGKPTLAIWEDFQCPYCHDFEASMGATITKLADDGKITLIWRPTTFLDAGQAEQSGPNPNSSARATAAWGCAIDAGKAAQYHQTLFANQPPKAEEGTGWTDQQLLDFGKQVGITDDAYSKFQACITAKTYTQWTTNSHLTFVNDAVPGTPTAYLNGKEVPNILTLTPSGLEDLIAKANSN
jgi:protein-disulfide isomerase